MFRLFKQLKNNHWFGSTHYKSFTLIELLIVIAILALLMSIVIIAINPSEMLKKSRDTKRISSLKALNNALGIFQATKPTSFMGTSTIVYVSIPDSSSTCTNLSLPTLPSGYTYQCSTTANYRKTDGTGWIPVNFNSLDIGSPISSLPIDPTNTTSTNLFFTYTTGGSWELNAILESSANKLSGDNDKTSLDGGDSYSTYEIGTDLTLSPYQDTGLVGYWRMDEGIGSTTKDTAASNTGTITGATWKTESDCKRGNCLYFDGTGDYITTSAFSIDPAGTILTVSGWVKMNINASEQNIIGESSNDGTIGFIYLNRYPGQNYLGWRHANGVGYTNMYMNTFFTGYDNTWIHFTIVADYSSTAVKWYRNGELIQTSNMTTPLFPSTNRAKYIGSHGANDNVIKGGNLDDIRIYNRGLSASEIKALYEGTK